MKTRIINRIKERRVEKGMTQQDLADAAGVSRQSVISIERGRYIPSLPLAMTLAEIFECPTDELFQKVEE